MKKQLLSILFFTLFAGITSLEAQSPIHTETSEDLVITFYSPSYTGVFDQRKVNMEQGINKIWVDDIPLMQYLDNLSVFLDGDLLESRHISEYNSIEQLLTRLSGQEVTLYGEETLRGTVVRYHGGLLELQKPDGSVMLIPNVRSYRLGLADASILRGLMSPLELRVHAERSGLQALNLFYISNKLGWKAEHRIVLDEDESRLNWETYAMINNNSNQAYENATLRFFSGQINLQSSPSPEYFARAAVQSVVADEYAVTQQQTGDYYVYTYGQKADIHPGQENQVVLHKFTDIEFEKKYIHNLSVHGSNSTNVRPQVTYDIKTDGDNGLNASLPGGKARFFAYGEDDISPTVRGESSMPFITPGDKINVSLGRASDITIAETRETTQDRSQQINEYKISAVVRNNKDEQVVVYIQQSLGSNMELISSNIEPVREGNNLTFSVSVDENGESTIELMVRQYMRR